jgi:hypothetical protein
MIYKITPTMISITFDEKVLNYKNAKKCLNIRIEDYDGETYQVSINECEKELIGVIRRGFNDFDKWTKTGKLPKVYKCDGPCAHAFKNDISYG